MNFRVLAGSAAHLFVKRVAGPFRARRRWLDKTQWLSSAELEEIQLRLLRRLVRHCYNTVPYYRELMRQQAISPESIRRLEDIEKFPVLTKKDILEAGDSIISTRYFRPLLRTAYTGGTTGTPLKIRRNWMSIGSEHAFVRRQWDWAGLSLADRCAYLTGRVIVKPDKENCRLYTYDPFMKELILSTYHLSPRTAKIYAEAMEKYRVRAVAGYPSAVHLLARSCLDYGIKLKLKAALTSSETLTESMRSRISRAFDCKVFDFYGGAERVCYILTCEQGSYHVIPEYGITELIPIKGEDGDKCRLVATGFWNLAMPLIRYDMGDIVIKSQDPCRCGRAYPVVKSILGRTADVVRTPSGRELGSAVLTHLLYGTDHIVESQIIQESLAQLTIQYVPTHEFSHQDLQSLERLLRQHLPSELKVDLKRVEKIERTSSGKIRPLVSKLY